jgi:hypothetical protein
MIFARCCKCSSSCGTGVRIIKVSEYKRELGEREEPASAGKFDLRLSSRLA